ncbi:MAG: LuxR C-terminal-related transcriptional regulator [bacterium]
MEPRTETSNEIAGLAWISTLISEGKYIAAAEAAGRAFEVAGSPRQRYFVLCEWEDVAFAMRPTAVTTPHPSVAGVVPALRSMVGNQALDEAQRAILLARLARQESWPDPSQPIPNAHTALAMARRSGDPTALIHALFALHMSLESPRFLPERLEISREMVELAGAHPLALMRAMAHQRRHVDCFVSGDSAGWELHLEQMTVAAAEANDLFFQSLATVANATRELVHGNYDRAEAAIPLLMEAGPRPSGIVMPAVTSIGLLARYQRGRGSTAGLSRMFSGVRAAHVAFRIGMAYYLATSGRPTEAIAEIGPVELADIPDDSGLIPCLCMAAELACFYLDDREMAAATYERLLPFEHLMAVPGDALSCWGPVSLYLGMAADYLGKPEARGHLELARKTAASFRARPWLARALVLLGIHDQGAGNPGADALLSEALAIAERIGYPAVATAARAALRPGAPARQRAPQSNQLTSRERQVLTMVARGMTAPEAAEALFLSPRTVEKHLEHAYAKIGARNRSEGISWAIVNGLTKDP